MIKNFITQLQNKQPILISYSGGLDSTVLLYQLIPFIYYPPFIKLRAIHINHNINKNSNIWNNHCKNVCKNHNITLLIKNIFFKNKKNFQNKARELRYTIIFKNMLPNEILVTGHHLNDQCETLFLSLKRGSGFSGLSGISYFKILKNNKKIFRPLIQYKKKELQQWAKSKNIKWIEDHSNFQNIYDRNFIRNTILDPIEKKWPFFIRNCSRSMNICYKQEQSLNYFLDNILINNTLCNNIINIKMIKKYMKEIQIILIKRWILINININISYKKIKEIYYHFIKTKNQNIKYTVKIKNYEIRSYKNKIYQINFYPSLKNTILYWHNHTKPLQLPYQLGQIENNQYGIILPKPKKTDIVSIRFNTCKTIDINTKNKKKIKNIWQENNIPPWNRNRIPILFYNDNIISILGLFNIQCNCNNIWNISWIQNYLH